MKIKAVSQIAFRDISNYLINTYNSCEVYACDKVVTPGLLDTKENRKLNRLLGLGGINKLHNKNQKHE